MFTLSKEDFSNIQPRNGIVIVEVDRLNYSSVGGISLIPGTSDTMAQNAIKSGKVVKVSPSNNPIGFFGKQYVPQIKEGDIVHFDYIIGMNILLKSHGQSTNSDNLLIVEDKKYVLVPYSMIFYRERDGQKQSLNGYVICSKIASKKDVAEAEEPDLLLCEMDCTEAVFDRQVYVPKKDDKFYYDGTPVPTEPEYIGEKQLFRVSPKNIYARL